MNKLLLRWVGGKRQLLNNILPLIPNNFNTYYEPFFGGGAVYFNLHPEKAFISDLNTEIINLYKIVKEYPQEFLNSLKGFIYNKSEFLYIRELDTNTLSDFENATRTFYLNRTCFNGLFRTNKKGKFNVPYGGNRKIDYNEIYDIVYNIHGLLKNCFISCSNYDTIKKSITYNDFVYLDPPYAPLTETSNFTNYTSFGFTLNDQIQLRIFCDWLNSNGIRFLLSNSYTKFILSEYNNYNIIPIQARRRVGGKGKSRNGVMEVLIKNY